MWYVMGALLAGAYALTWWQQIVNRPVERILQEAAEAPPGCEGLLFRPHLNGERGPGSSSNASFSRLTASHDARHMSRAVLEGVAFALGDCLYNVSKLGAVPTSIIFGGGGAKSDLWGQIIASTFNLPLTRLQGDEQTALGAAMLAAIGTGHFADFDAAAKAWVRVAEVIEPVAEWVPIYQQRYRSFWGINRDDVT
jgi:xylulokinase